MQHNFKELKIWNRSMDATVEIYNICKLFPYEERFGLTAQLKKSAVSIPSNIAEGAGRNTNPDFVNFLGYANGSSCEAVTQLILANMLDMVSEEKIKPILRELDELQKMTCNFQEFLKRKAA